MAVKGVPPGLYRAVQSAILATLRASPALADGRAIRTWVAWDGREVKADMTVDMMPACEVRILSGPTRRLCGARIPGGPMTFIYETRLTALIDIQVAGTDAGDLADLAGLVDAAMGRPDPRQRAAVQERLRKAGVKDVRPGRPILPASGESYGLQSIAGQGSYDLIVQHYG